MGDYDSASDYYEAYVDEKQRPNDSTAETSFYLYGGNASSDQDSHVAAKDTNRDAFIRINKSLRTICYGKYIQDPQVY